MAHVLKTAVIADIQDFIIRVTKRLTGLFDTKGVEVFGQGFAQRSFEKTTEILGIHTGQIGKLMKIDPVRVIFMDVA